MNTFTRFGINKCKHTPPVHLITMYSKFASEAVCVCFYDTTCQHT